MAEIYGLNKYNLEPRERRELDTRSSFLFVWFMFNASSVLISACAPELEEIPLPEYSELFLSDDFDEDPVANNRWNVEYGDGSQYGEGLSGWGNAEKQLYRRDNVYVKDGILYIEAKKENGVYTSARITTGAAWTRDGVEQPMRWKISRGKVEARIKPPEGRGFWPAFWLLGADSFNRHNGEAVTSWPRCGEMDILEIKGENARKLYSTIHYGESYPWPYNYTGGEYTHSESLAADWHVYGAVWDEEAVNFTFDGEVFKSIALNNLEGGAEWAHPETFYDDAGFVIILNLAIGGSFIGGQEPEDSVFQGPLEKRCLMVDWVRAYK